MTASNRPKTGRTRNFFKLQEPFDTLTKPKQFFDRINTSDGVVENLLYKPYELRGSTSRFPRKIRETEFRNVSFTRTHIESISFYGCVFNQCLFINSRIEHCEFHNCSFVDTNTHKIDFLGVYVDPNSFENCLKAKSDQNIGTHLYQRLMNNSNDENQRAFGRSASLRFNTWKRRQWFYEFKRDWRTKPGRSIHALASGLVRWFWGLWGAGVHLGRFILSFAFTILLLSSFNFVLREQLGLDAVTEIVDSIYFTVITMTTIGYGDITPSNTFGKVVMAGEGFLGFFLFALAASIVFRRIAP